MSTRSNRRQYRQGLKPARLIMVLSGLSPLFILWAVRGTSLFPDMWFIPVCVLIAIIPTAFLWLRLKTAQRQNDKRLLTAGTLEDNRGHVLVYLFAILLPFYRTEVATMRDMVAMVMALAFIVFLFWHLNLHYMNFLFAIFDYRVFNVFPSEDGNPYTGKEAFILVTRRRSLLPGDRFSAYRLSDTVYVESHS